MYLHRPLYKTLQYKMVLATTQFKRWNLKMYTGRLHRKMTMNDHFLYIIILDIFVWIQHGHLINTDSNLLWIPATVLYKGCGIMLTTVIIKGLVIVRTVTLTNCCTSWGKGGRGRYCFVVVVLDDDNDVTVKFRY